MPRNPEWATGNVGKASLRAIVETPDFELVGLYVYNPDKAGQDANGMSQPTDYKTPLENEGPVEENAYYTSPLLMQDAFGLKFDGVVRSTEKALARNAIQCPWGVVEKGTIAGLRMRIRGMLNGEPRFTSDMVWKVTGDVPDDWPTGDSSWIIGIEGDPAINCRFDIESKTGRTVSHVTAMAAFNRVRDVIAAQPSIRTRLDFPLTSGGRISHV